jgi:hypothetical protein
MRDMRLLPLLMIVSTMLFGSSCFGQSISLRVMDEQGSKPIPGKKVKIYFYDRLPQEYGAWDFPALTLKTDTKGEVHFDLWQPRTFYVVASVSLPRSQWECACFVVSRTADVINTGRVEGGPRSGPQPNRIAGQIEIWARPSTLWERIFYPILQ